LAGTRERRKENIVKCIYCGWKNPDTVTFCRKCGAQLTISSPDKPLVSFPVSDALTSLNAEHAHARRRAIWRVVWIALAVVLIGGAGITWWVTSATQASADVTQTLQTYCSAFKNANWQQAYDQWSNTTQMSEKDFEYTQQSKSKVIECETGTISTASSTAQATLTFFYANGSSAADQINLIQENGVWKIKSQSLS